MSRILDAVFAGLILYGSIRMLKAIVIILLRF